MLKSRFNQNKFNQNIYIEEIIKNPTENYLQRQLKNINYLLSADEKVDPCLSSI